MKFFNIFAYFLFENGLLAFIAHTFEGYKIVYQYIYSKDITRLYRKKHSSV